MGAWLEGERLRYESEGVEAATTVLSEGYEVALAVEGGVDEQRDEFIQKIEDVTGLYLEEVGMD